MTKEEHHEYTPEEENAMIEQAYQELLQAYLSSNHRKKVEIIERAYRFARRAHAGVRRRSGEPYIMHPIAVAKIVISELGLGSTSICAALLHDVVEDTEYTRDDIAATFGEKIASIVEGLTKISGGIFGAKASLQAENFRKLLLSMSTDVRVVLIKMADRLHNMRTLGSMRPEKQFKIAGETLYVYAPLAHRLGLFKIKTELEDLAFRYEHPAKYAEIVSLVNETDAHREQIVEKFVAPVRKKLDAAGFKYEIKARVKSAFSIYNKMENKHVGFNEIYDIYAVRVIFENDDDALERIKCWQIYTFFTDGHRTHPDRLRDWTSTPKANGYRALHLTVMGPEGKWIEVQIRSRKMDDIAELGYAAHWKYKTGVYEEETELDNWIGTIKDILANPEPNAIDFLDTIKLNLFSSEIYVFTPKGDLYTLPAGSTVLDLAFAIHSELGIHCMAGKISHKLVPISHVLESGDQVEIITSATQQPQPEWIQYCHSAKAQNRLRAILRRDRRSLALKGKNIFLEFLEKKGLQFSQSMVSRLVSNYHLSSEEEFYLMLASDEIDLKAPELQELGRTRSSLLSKILRNPFSSKKKGGKEKDRKKQINRKEVYVLRPGDNPNYRLESCCRPVPGDDVLGFVDDDENVVVHKLNCTTAMRLKTAFGSRLVATRWEGKADSFTATLEIEGLDRLGMIGDIANSVSGEELGINIRALSITADGTVFNASITVQIDTTATLDKVIQAIGKVKGVRNVSRVS
ncbi:MAG: bifunctional (p)ppGpp synthetase/guanosine-3',5'-bis(diphosphate) 3'-pyrophosphohydrolase [Muribaculaceae bacterium]|nr:bifunctional (p)ppGpp synthetase/guanosine-3',5'-bis(diphosphate) 3'-pyrophosphohydrolase [Muribaculaceae bacterium]